MLCNNLKKELPVIISLTSIPSRINTLHLVIKSLFHQTYRPKKIVLWLNDDLKGRIPRRLRKLESSLFEIHYSALTCSHRKLIHSLKMYPNETIITCDDDLIYDKNWLGKLYQQHLKYPADIIANEVTQIKIDSDGNYLPGVMWRKVDLQGKLNSFLPIGAWGILYPASSLSQEIFNQKLFLELTPKADDLWFKGMALLQGTNSRQSEDIPVEPIPIIGTQKISLKKENVGKNKNDVQWLALSNYYDLLSILKND